MYRFEDKLGVHTLVSRFKGLECDEEQNRYVQKDLIIQYGLGLIPCITVDNIVDLCEFEDIKRVVMFFDLDGLDQNHKILTYEDIVKKIQRY